MGNIDIIKRQPHLFIIIPVVIIIIFALFYVVLIPEASDDGMTAMESNVFAEDIARDWNPSAVLVEAYISRPDLNGTSDLWVYRYSNLTSSIQIRYYENGTYFIDDIADPPFTIPIDNWLLDSDEVINILKRNSTFEQWLEENEDAWLSFMKLTAITNNTTVWEIEWRTYLYTYGTFTELVSATIQIDANSGEIYYILLRSPLITP